MWQPQVAAIEAHAAPGGGLYDWATSTPEQWATLAPLAALQWPVAEPIEDDEAFDDDAPREDDELDDEELEDDDGQPDEDADVLEDTPDFLQETPEHDRLWFEQKPPRDFDFD